MTIELTTQNIITAASLLTAIGLIIREFAKGVRWVDRQDKQTTDIEELRSLHSADIKATNEELRVIVHGLLACLKGLQEQGCNGPVTREIAEIENHLNAKAHEQ